MNLVLQCSLNNIIIPCVVFRVKAEQDSPSAAAPKEESSPEAQPYQPAGPVRRRSLRLLAKASSSTPSSSKQTEKELVPKKEGETTSKKAIHRKKEEKEEEPSSLVESHSSPVPRRRSARLLSNAAKLQDEPSSSALPLLLSQGQTPFLAVGSSVESRLHRLHPQRASGKRQQPNRPGHN